MCAWVGSGNKCGDALGAGRHATIRASDAQGALDLLPARLTQASSCLHLPQEDLARARQSFVMTTELHLTYLCVPVTETVAVLDWKRFESMLGTLSVGLHAGHAVSVGCVQRVFCGAASIPGCRSDGM